MSFKRIRIHSSVSCLSLILALTCSGLVIAAENRPLPATQPAAAAGQQVVPAAVTTQPAGQPALSVDAAEHDFGQVRSGEKVEHRFKITNTGSTELEISNVKPNCGCTRRPEPRPCPVWPNQKRPFLASAKPAR